MGEKRKQAKKAHPPSKRDLTILTQNPFLNPPLKRKGAHISGIIILLQSKKECNSSSGDERKLSPAVSLIFARVDTSVISGDLLVHCDKMM